MRVTRLTFLLCLFISANGSAQDAPAPNKAALPPSNIFGLTEDITSLPIVMVREFPFVTATINGVPGKLMFDTGKREALSLNDHKTPLKGGKVVGGRGPNEQRLYPELASVDLAGGHSYRSITHVMGEDLSSMEENITPDFLGFIGQDFYRGYLFKLDFKKNRITFYRRTKARRQSKDYLFGESVIAVVGFMTYKSPTRQLIPLTIGGINFIGAFGTGMEGAVYMNKATRASLTEQRLLTPAPDRGDSFYDIVGIGPNPGFSLTPGFKAAVSGIQVFNKAAPDPFGLTGAPEPNIIQFGYAFLRQYKTIWDFSESRIYLLKP